MTFAEKLRELRESKGWSQVELASKSDNSQQAIANWEKGIRVPAFDAVQALCKALGEPCTIFDGCEHAEIKNPRGRGRPATTPAEPIKPTKNTKKKKGGA